MSSSRGDTGRQDAGQSNRAELPKQQPRPKPRAKTTKSKPPKIAPLPASIDVRGYEITIPNTKFCWRVSIVHSCGHPVVEVSQVRYPGCDKPLVAEVNRHMRPCTEKCKVDGLSHIVEGLCGECRQSKHNEDDQVSRLEGVDANGVGEVMWNGLPQI